jgi:DNA polymerase III subunit delta'
MAFVSDDLVGQHRVKELLNNIIERNRVGHAYLFSGPKGSGMLPFALRFAECINQKKDGQKMELPWHKHPDIHVFIPMPSSAGIQEKNERLEWLSEDSYNLIEYADRPDSDKERSKNRQAFYSIDYFRSEIRPVTRLRPYQGKKVVVIMTQVETMRKETANSFLKLLEEPSEGVLFILTTHHYEQLLPTITSRCQHITFGQNTLEEVQKALIERDQMPKDKAAMVAKLTQANYAKSKDIDLDVIHKIRSEMIDFIRNSYVLDAIKINSIILNWTSTLNTEGLIQLIELLESFLRDLIVYSHTQNTESLIHEDEVETIKNIVLNLKEADYHAMIDILAPVYTELRQNVQPKLLLTVLAFNFSTLLRGQGQSIPKEKAFMHLPALQLNQ